MHALASIPLRVPTDRTSGRRNVRTLATRSLKRLQALGLRPFLQDVPIDRLRHDGKHVFSHEGYGRQPIEDTPTYQFFRAFVEGRTEDARVAFEQLYAAQFRRWAFVSKGKGGMFNGSLYREVVRGHREAGVALDRDKPRFDDALVARAIARRVQQRFGLVRSIERDGYRPSTADPVVGVVQPDGTIVIEGGAHRAAALLALEHEVMPGVLVVSARMRRVLTKLKVIK